MVTSMGFEPMHIAVKGRRVKPLHQLAMLLGFNIKYFLRTSYRAKERKYLRCISNLTCITNFWQPHLISLGHRLSRDTSHCKYQNLKNHN